MILFPSHNPGGFLCKLLVVFLFLTLPFLAKSQETKRVKDASAKRLELREYDVLKSDKDIKHGEYKEFYKDVLITEGAYNHGKRDGMWNFYDYGDIINFNGKYKNGVKDSTWTYYRTDALQAKMYYSDGQLDSAFSYYPDCSLWYSIIKDSSGTGRTIAYYQNGAVMSYTPYVNGVREGIATWGYENGNVFRELEFENGKPKTLLGTLNSEGDTIFGGSLKNGTGTYIEYKIDTASASTLEPIAFATYKKGLLDGSFISYPKGDVAGKKGKYQEGYMVGKWTYFSADSVIETKEYNLQDSVGIVTSDSIGVEAMSTTFNIFIRDEIQMGYFPDGQYGMSQFLINNLRYPNRAKSRHNQGTVYISFILSEEGSLKSFEVLRTPGPSLGREVIRVAKQMPRWNPNFSNGIPLQVLYNFPFRFIMR